MWSLFSIIRFVDTAKELRYPAVRFTVQKYLYHSIVICKKKVYFSKEVDLGYLVFIKGGKMEIRMNANVPRIPKINIR